MKTSTTTTKNAFTVNFFKMQIEGTKTAFARASKPGTNEYNELIVLLERHPSFKLHALEPKKHITGSKKTYGRRGWFSVGPCAWAWLRNWIKRY